MRGGVRKRGRKWAWFADREPDPVTGRRKQSSKSGYASKQDAERALRRELARRDEGFRMMARPTTVADFLRNEWLPNVERTVRTTTLKSYRDLLESHVIPGIGSLRLDKVTPAHLNGLYQSLLRSGRCDGTGGLSPRTVRYAHTLLRKALADAVRWNRVVRNVAEYADPPSHRRPEARVWTAPEVRRFVAATRTDRLGALFALALATGMRRGELLGLRWSDVDLDVGRVSVRQTLVLVGHTIQVSRPKTNASRRSITLDPVTTRILRKWQVAQHGERTALGAAAVTSDLVFTTEDGSPLHPAQVSKTCLRLARNAGLPPISIHGLRHSAATLMLSTGVPLKVASARLGHSSVAITADTYQHALASIEEQAAASIGTAIHGEEQ